MPSPLLFCADDHCTFYMESEKSNSVHKRTASDELTNEPTPENKKKVCSLFPRGGLKPPATKHTHHHQTPPSSLPHTHPTLHPAPPTESGCHAVLEGQPRSTQPRRDARATRKTARAATTMRMWCTQGTPPKQRRASSSVATPQNKPHPHPTL